MIYFAWINNHTDSKDDDVLKILAKNEADAKEYAESYCRSRGGVSVEYVMKRKDFKDCEPGWHTLLWGSTPHIAG